MRMNTSIPMMGQSPDIFGSFVRGRQARQQQNEFDHTNAFRAMMQEAGPGIVSGDENALARLAQFDPNAALGVQQTRLGMDATRQNMEMQREAARRAAAEAAANMTEAERRRNAEALQGGLRGAGVFYQRGDQEGYNRFLTQQGIDPAQFPFADFEAHAARIGGIIEGLAAPRAPITVAPGATVFDPNTNQPVFTAPDRTPAGFRQATPQEAAQFGATAGQFGPDGRFYPINPPSGFEVVTGPDGNMTVRQGAGVGSAAGRPLTEGQSRDNVYATRARGALEVLEPNAEALMSRADILLGMAPLGATRGFQSPAYQQALIAGDEFLQAILRKDTGAAITTQEREEYGRVYLPQPGDSPEVTRARREARARALAALEAGMSEDQLRTVTAAQRAAIETAGRLAGMGGQGQPAAPAQAAPAQPAAPVQPGRYRFNPETGEMEPIR